MKKIKILLSDPRHNTVGIHSNCVPIGIGYIASNIIQKFPDQLDVKLSTDVNRSLKIIDGGNQIY